MTEDSKSWKSSTRGDQGSPDPARDPLISDLSQDLYARQLFEQFLRLEEKRAGLPKGVEIPKWLAFVAALWFVLSLVLAGWQLRDAKATRDAVERQSAGLEQALKQTATELRLIQQTYWEDPKDKIERKETEDAGNP